MVRPLDRSFQWLAQAAEIQQCLIGVAGKGGLQELEDGIFCGILCWLGFLEQLDGE